VNAFAVVIVVVVGLIVLLALGGALAAARRARSLEADLKRRIGEANEGLALARAQDRGWDRDTLDAVARAAFTELHPGKTVDTLLLVQVEDRPGTDEDVAVFQVVSGGRESTVTLGRRAGVWGPRSS
jgi:hypothetical protein